MTQLCAEKGVGGKVMASWDTVSPGGSSGRDARLMVAWGACYAKCGLWLSSHSKVWVVSVPCEPLAERMCLGECR